MPDYKVNGKKRSVVEADKNISESDLLNLIKKNENINKIIKDKKIEKSFFVQNKLINILINE